jgi:hypothetical protein
MAATNFRIGVKQCPDSNMVLTALGSSVVQAPWNGGQDQLWIVQFNQFDNGGDWVSGYSLINVGNNLACRFSGDNQPLTMAPNSVGDRDFVWRLDNVGGDFYAINRWDENGVFDVKGDSCDVGAVVLVFPWNKGDNQKWHFIAV